MPAELCQNKQELHQFMMKNKHMFLYALGDLDEFFWPNTRYYVRRKQGEISAVIVVYQTTDLPIVMCFSDDNDETNRLAKELLPTFSQRVYAHISPGCEVNFLETFRCTYHETQRRMILTKPEKLLQLTDNIEPFGSTDAQRLKEFFALSYPANWFDERMLETNQFFGYRLNNQLISVAGIHVYSPEYKVAALGNITTHPDFRGKGYAQLCASAVCHSLRKTTDLIGLNVHSENTAAIRCYESIGFEAVYDFSEMMLER
jgi:ribosomal protein S18 acetylase RimI-like enzyme